MFRQNNLVRCLGYMLAVALTLGCYFIEGEPETYNPYVAPPTDIPQVATELPPLPDFAEQILLFGYGGGSGPVCGNFDVPGIPFVVGRTTYPNGRVDYQSYSGGGPRFEYPRGAELCLIGMPKDVAIEIRMTSPSQQVTLKTTIKIVNIKDHPSLVAVEWVDYPDKWMDDEKYTIRSFAAREGDDPQNLNTPISVSLGLWWPGSLEEGIWRVEVSWPVQFVYGEFLAETRGLSEVSLGDPGYDTTIFPNMMLDRPYTCRPALYNPPYFAVLEGFPPNTLIHVLIYQVTKSGLGQELSFTHQVVTHSNEQGVGQVEITTNFNPGSMYYLFGVTDPMINLAVDTDYHDAVFNFTSIANAMDCFFIP